MKSISENSEALKPLKELPDKFAQLIELLSGQKNSEEESQNNEHNNDPILDLIDKSNDEQGMPHYTKLIIIYNQ